jgi:hypothetical protein
VAKNLEKPSGVPERSEMRCDDCGKKPGTADAMPGLRSQALLFSTTAHAISRARVSLTPMIAVAGL